jgi:hypothetical protein
MRKQTIALVAAIALGALGGSAIAHAQTANAPFQKKIFGFQDSRGNFHPLGTNFDPMADPTTATTTYSGTIEVTVTVTLKTPLPSGDKVACSVDASASSDMMTTPFTTVGYGEDAASFASVSGSTATCKVNIPYSWVLLTPSTTIINSLQGDLDVVMYSPTATTISTLLENFVREHTQGITINGGKPGDGTLTVSAAVTI